MRVRRTRRTAAQSDQAVRHSYAAISSSISIPSLKETAHDEPNRTKQEVIDIQARLSWIIDSTRPDEHSVVQATLETDGRIRFGAEHGEHVQPTKSGHKSHGND